jgi:hypothetical protein
MYGKIRNAYKILVRYPQGNKLLGERKHELDDNIKTNLRDTECEGVN